MTDTEMLTTKVKLQRHAHSNVHPLTCMFTLLSIVVPKPLDVMRIYQDDAEKEFRKPDSDRRARSNWTVSSCSCVGEKV